MRMKRQREAVQRNFPNSRSRVHLAKLLAITVFQVREANRYSGLRSLHVVHGDEASAFIIALFPSKALHCRENRAKTCQTLQSKSKMSVHSAMSLLTCRSTEGGRCVMRNERKAISRIRKGGRCVSQYGDPSDEGSSRSLGASSTAQKRRVPSRAADTAWFAYGKYATAVTTSWCAWTCATAALEANMLQRHVEITGSLRFPHGPWSVFGACVGRDHGPFRSRLPGGPPRTSGPVFRLFTTAPREQNP